jgi:hypothetical protein
VGFSGVDPGLRGRHVRRFPEREGSRLDLSAPAVAALFRIGVWEASCDRRRLV